MSFLKYYIKLCENVDKFEPHELSFQKFHSDPDLDNDPVHHYFHHNLAPKEPTPYHTGNMNMYTEDSYATNDALWKNSMNDTGISPFHANIIHHLTNMINHHTDAPKEDVHVLSGIKSDPNEWIKKGDEGNIIHVPSFTSTTISPRTARSFSRTFTDQHTTDGVHTTINNRHVLKIHVKKGQKVGSYIREHSNFKAEAEFLVKPNVVLKLNKTPTTYENINHGGDHVIHDRIHVWDAHIMDDDELKKHEDHPEVEDYHKMKNKLSSMVMESTEQSPHIKKPFILGIGNREKKVIIEVPKKPFILGIGNRTGKEEK